MKRKSQLLSNFYTQDKEMPGTKPRANNLPRTAMGAFRRYFAAKATRKAPAAPQPSSAKSRERAAAAAALLGLTFHEYRQALAAQEELDRLAGARPKTGSSEALGGIYNLFVHKLYREGARIVNERGDGNCLFRAIARQELGDEGRYQMIRDLLQAYYISLAEGSEAAIDAFFTENGETIVNDYIEDWYRNRTLDKLSADQKKRIDEIHEKLKPFPAGSIAEMSAAERETFTRLSKQLRDIYGEGAPTISVDSLEEKRAFLRMYTERIGDGSQGSAFWGGEVDIRMLSNILQKVILVYPSATTIRYDYWYLGPPRDGHIPDQILLLFSGGNHYKSILAPEGKTITEWIGEVETDIENLSEYGIAYDENGYMIIGNYLSGKTEDSPAAEVLLSVYRNSGRKNWRELAHLAFQAAQHMRPSSVVPTAYETPVGRQGRTPQSAPKSASGSRRNSQTRRTLEAAAAALAALTPRSGASTPPSPKRRPQPQASAFGVPSALYQPPGTRPSRAQPQATIFGVPSPAYRPPEVRPPAARTTRRVANIAKNPLFNSATRKAAAPPPPPRFKKGWWARLLGLNATRKKPNGRVAPPPVPTIPSITKMVAAAPPTLPPPPPGGPTLEQRAAAARRKQINNADLFGKRVAFLRAEDEKRRGLRGQPAPGARPPHFLPPLVGPNGKLIPRPPPYPKPKGGRRTMRRKIGKARRTRGT